MADEILARARAARSALDAESYGGSAESGALRRIGRENTFIREARVLMPDLATEVERLRGALNRAEELAEQWAQAAAEKGRRRHVFADELRAALRGDQ